MKNYEQNTAEQKFTAIFTRAVFFRLCSKNETSFPYVKEIKHTEKVVVSRALSIRIRLRVFSRH